MQEKLTEKKAAYTLHKDAARYVVRNVPARVNVATGELLFSPDTAGKLQKIIRENNTNYPNQLNYQLPNYQLPNYQLPNYQLPNY